MNRDPMPLEPEMEEWLEVLFTYGAQGVVLVTFGKTLENSIS